MANQYCECGFETYQDVVFANHEAQKPQSCLRHWRERALVAEAKQSVAESVLNAQTDKFTKEIANIAIKQSQLMAPKAAKELEQFVKEPNRY